MVVSVTLHAAGHPYMMSAKFLEFWPPLPFPLSAFGTDSRNLPYIIFLGTDLAQPHPVRLSYVDGPLPLSKTKPRLFCLGDHVIFM